MAVTPPKRDNSQGAATVAVVIRCRNEEAHIGRLLTGLVRQRRRPDEIIVVDSGSTDATLAIASAFPVKVVQIDAEDFSFGAACNVGCAEATSDFAVFISAHCYPVYDSWLSKLIEPFESDEIALAYGRQVGPPDARFSEKRLFSSWFPGQSVPRQRIPFCNNANAAIRRSVWEDGLRYDEVLTGLEDLDWAKRAIDDGFLISYVAEAPVIHVHDEISSQIVNRYRREAIAHRQIYNEQRMRLRQAVRFATVNIVQDWTAARKEGALRENLVDIPRFRSAQFYGTFRGFMQTGPVTESLKQRFYFPDDAEPDPTGDSNEVGQAIDYDEPVDTTELS